jgi:hypothetical protein
MKLVEKVGGSVMRKAVLATVLMGGFLAFLGAGTASAHPRVFVSIGGPVVVGGYYGGYYGPPAPYWGPAYVGPRYVYGHRYYYGPRYSHYRYWDARFRCWRYR